MVIAVASCGNPRLNTTGNEPPLNNSGGTGPVVRPSASLRPASKVGDRFRTTRVLRVEESADRQRIATESEEVTLTEVLAVDDAGRLMAVRRAWESSVTRLSRDGRQAEEGRGSLDGCTLQLTQRAGRVEAKLIAGDVSLRGANFLIEGFDSGLLPLDPVREGDYWVLESGRLSGLNVILEAMQLKVEKNKLTCQLMRLSDASAVISLDWRISGEMDKRPIVLEFSGSMEFDRGSGLVTSLQLQTSPQLEDGPAIRISIARRMVSGWLDLDG